MKQESFCWLLNTLGSILDFQRGKPDGQEIKITSKQFRENLKSKDGLFLDIFDLTFNKQSPKLLDLKVRTALLRFTVSCLENPCLVKDQNFGYSGLIKEVCRRMNYGANLMREFDQVLCSELQPKHQHNFLVAMTEIIFFFCQKAQLLASTKPPMLL